MKKCNHKNKQFTWEGHPHPLTCVLEKDHEGYHKGFAPKKGTPVSDTSKHPGKEFIQDGGIDYTVEEHLVMWGDEEGKDLEQPSAESAVDNV